jgi:uncharacterized protein (DUF427 family)
MINHERMTPGPGQESVWDYPRPPRVEDSSKHIQVIYNGVVVADTYRAKRVLETSHPPVYYIPPEDIKMEHLTPTGRATWCEWKGQAAYYILRVGKRQTPNAAWFYPRPSAGFDSLKNYVAFYPGLMDACFVNGERVQAQAGDFYGGWITADIVGPFKGGPGTRGW